MKNISILLLMAISIGFGACSKTNDVSEPSVGITVQLKSSSAPVTNAQIVLSGTMDSLYNFERHHEDGTYNTCTAHAEHQNVMNGNTVTFNNMMTDTNYYACYTRIGNCNYYGTSSLPVHAGMHQNLTMVLDSCEASLSIKCRINGTTTFLQGVDVVFSTTDVGMTGHHGEHHEGGKHNGGYSMYDGNSNTNGIMHYTNLVPGYYYYDCSYGKMMDSKYSGHGKIEIKPGTHQEIIVDLK